MIEYLIQGSLQVCHLKKLKTHKHNNYSIKTSGNSIWNSEVLFLIKLN